jgi:predicted CoA-binding protein
MTLKEKIDDFLSQKSFAVVGVSRDGKNFGWAILKDLRERGYKVYPVNPNADSVNNEKCYPDLKSLPEKVDGVVLTVKPEITPRIVYDALSAGIKKLWMQQGSGSEDAIKLCEENGITEIHSECILMFASPTAIPHRLHRWIWKVIGKLPQ